MDITKYSELFTKRAWQKGQQLYQDGKVENYRKKGDNYVCEVLDVGRHTTQVRIHKGIPGQWKCDCKQKVPCSHIAALMLCAAAQDKTGVRALFFKDERLLSEKEAYYLFRELLSQMDALLKKVKTNAQFVFEEITFVITHLEHAANIKNDMTMRLLDKAKLVFQFLQENGYESYVREWVKEQLKAEHKAAYLDCFLYLYMLKDPHRLSVLLPIMGDAYADSTKCAVICYVGNELERKKCKDTNWESYFQLYEQQRACFDVIYSYYKKYYPEKAYAQLCTYIESNQFTKDQMFRYADDFRHVAIEKKDGVLLLRLLEPKLNFISQDDTLEYMQVIRNFYEDDDWYGGTERDMILKQLAEWKNSFHMIELLYPGLLCLLKEYYLMVENVVLDDRIDWIDTLQQFIAAYDEEIYRILKMKEIMLFCEEDREYYYDYDNTADALRECVDKGREDLFWEADIMLRQKYPNNRLLAQMLDGEEDALV